MLLDACLEHGVAKVVHTSTSAIYGVPESNPVTEETPPRPAEEYGRAKLDAEHLCRAAVSRGLDVSIVRPRTILGHGRLGIFTLLFDWMDAGSDVFVLGSGDNRYQFVHPRDLADACIRAGKQTGPGAYNIGSDRFGTTREALEGLIRHAGAPSRVRSLPMRPTVAAMQALSAAGLAPFAPYHWIMFGRSMWSYDWYLAHRGAIDLTGSHHSKPVRQGALKLAGRLMTRRR